MHTTSWLKLKTRKRWNKKGFSSIVGAIFMILIIGMMASAYFMYTLAQNSNYNDAVKASNIDEISLMSESINVTSAPTYAPSSNTVGVSAALQNDGPVYVRIKTLWVHGVNNNYYGFADLSSLNINLSPGQTYTLGTSVTVQGASAGQTYYAWIITERGKTIMLYPAHQTGPEGPQGPQGQTGATGPIGSTGPQGPQGTTSYDANTALVSQGIGSVAMNFTKFRTYDFGAGNTPPPNGTALIAGTESTMYTIHDTHFYAIRIALVNMDASTTKISISSKSYIWGLNPQSGTVKSFSWNIMHLGADGKLYTGNNFYIDLPYDTQVYAYFGIAKSEIGSAAIPAVVPLNILLYGNFVYQDSSTAEYGQNLPFVALNIPFA